MKAKAETEAKAKKQTEEIAIAEDGDMQGSENKAQHRTDAEMASPSRGIAQDIFQR